MNPDMLSIIPRLSREESKVLMLALAEHMRAIDLGKANRSGVSVITYNTENGLHLGHQVIPRDRSEFQRIPENGEFERIAELFEKCWGFED